MPSTRGEHESPRGTATIQISRSYHYDALVEPQTADEKLRCQFELAVTIVHELAHAAFAATTGSQYETFFEGSVVAEAGFEFEARVFGLIPTRSPEGYLAWYKWPCCYALEEPLYDLQDLCRNHSRLENDDPVADVEDGFIARLFQDKFWNQSNAEHRARKLIATPIRLSLTTGEGSQADVQGTPSTVADMFPQAKKPVRWRP